MKKIQKLLYHLMVIFN